MEFFLFLSLIALAAVGYKHYRILEEQIRELVRRADYIERRIESLLVWAAPAPPPAESHRGPATAPETARGDLNAAAMGQAKPAGSPSDIWIHPGGIPAPVAAAAPARDYQQPRSAFSPPAAPWSAWEIDWEKFMGVKLFAWLGGFGLFLGMAFFVKYSIDHNLISPLMRVVIGALVGVSAVAGGLFVRKSGYEITAQTLCAAGIAILYADIYASRSYYGFLDPTAAFILMAVVTLASFLLAVGLRSRYVAILGLIGGFLTPPVLSTGEDHPILLFSYIALLDLGLVAMALHRRWSFLLPLSAGATLLTEGGWTAAFLAAGNGVAAAVICLAFCLLYFLGSEAARRMNEGRWRFHVTAVLMPLLSVGFVLNMIRLPELGARPAVVLTLLLLLGILSGCLAVRRADMLWPYLIMIGAAFVTLWTWTASSITPGLLNPGLGHALAFALFHSGVLLFLLRLRPEQKVLRWGCLIPMLMPFALFALACELIPISDPSLLFACMMLLVVLLMILARARGLDLSILVALPATLMVETAWYFGNHPPATLAMPLSWFAVFYGLYTIFPFVAVGKQRARHAWTASALAGPLHFFLIFHLVSHAAINIYPGLIPALFALPSLAGLVRLVKTVGSDDPRRNTLLALFGGASLFFLTLIVPVQFDRAWITVGFAIEGTALLWLYRRIPHRGLKGWAWALLLIAFVRLAFNPAILHYYPRTGVPLLNWYFFVFGAVAACMFLAARLLPISTRFQLIESLTENQLLQGMGTILAFQLVNIEVADWFSTGRTLTLDFSGNLARDMTYSLAWAAFATILLLIGIRQNSKGARNASLGLLLITIFKVFLYDLWQLSQLYRVGSIIGLALVLILVSFLYQRYLGRGSRGAP